MNIISNLYYSDIQKENIIPPTKEEYEKSEKLCLKLHDKLYESMSNTQKELFNKFLDAQIDNTGIEKYSTFCDGFKLGMRLMISALSE